jgi:DNA-binding SARP family transcriptional activator/TolB-like protein
MLRLLTFGALAIERDRAPLSGANAQLGRLALLAVLAAAGEAGVARHKLIAVLWPDSDDERGRNALKQAIFANRRDLGGENPILGTRTLRLDAAVISSDLREFVQACEADSIDRADALYRGPFLDAVNATRTPDFEHWVDAERHRLRELFAKALERTGDRESSRGNHLAAVRAWRRCAELDPVSSRITVAYMRALAASGDVPAALAHARQNEQYVKEVLECPPDPQLQAEVRALRARAGNTVPLPPPVNHGESPAPATSDARAEEIRSRRPRVSPLSRRRAVIWVAIPAVFALVVSRFPSGGAAKGNAAVARESGMEMPAQTAIAILPFRVTGTDAGLPFLADALPDLLAAKVGGVTGLSIIDPRVSVEAWRSAATNGGEAPLAQAIEVAQRLGAGQVLTGTVIGSTGLIQLTGRLAKVSGTDGVVEAAVTGPPDSLIFLIDQLAAELLTLADGESPARVKSITRSRLPAVKAYLSGQKAYRDGRYDEAADRFRDALQLDSTFALAAFRLALASGWAGRAAAEGDSAVARAWAVRDRLIPRDYAFLRAFATGRIPQLHTNRQEVYQRWENAISEVPDWPEVWAEYGDRFFHEGRVPFDATTHSRAAAALRRALELDSMFLPAIPHAVQLAAVGGDTASVRRLATRYVTRDSSSGTAAYIRWRAAHALGDSAGVRRLRSAFHTTPRVALRWIIQAAQFDGVAAPNAAAAAQALIGRGGSTEELIDAYLLAHDVALNGGRPVEALAALEGVDAARPRTQDADRRRVLDALYSVGDTLAAGAADARIAISAEGAIEKSVQDRAMQYRNMCVHAQWRLSRRDLPTVARMIARLMNVANPAGVLPESAHGEVAVCRALLEAMTSVGAGRAELRTRLATLESIIVAASPGDGLAYFPIARSRLYAESGDTALALSAVRERIYFAFNAPYMTTHLREEARYALTLSDTAGAVRALRHYVALRHGAAGPAGAEAVEAQALLERLEREHH